MSRNAVAAMAVVFVSGFAGCAATARSEEPVAVSQPTQGALTMLSSTPPRPMIYVPRWHCHDRAPFSAAGSG